MPYSGPWACPPCPPPPYAASPRPSRPAPPCCRCRESPTPSLMHRQCPDPCPTGILNRSCHPNRPRNRQAARARPYTDSCSSYRTHPSNSQPYTSSKTGTGCCLDTPTSRHSSACPSRRCICRSRLGEPGSFGNPRRRSRTQWLSTESRRTQFSLRPSNSACSFSSSLVPFC